MNTELNGHQDAGQTPQDPPPPVSSRRRRILKLALTSAPFAITLPNGAALANISAYQCIAKNRSEDPPKAILNTDRWERVIVFGYNVTVELDATITLPPGTPPPNCSSIGDGIPRYYLTQGDVNGTPYQLVNNELTARALPILPTGCKFVYSPTDNAYVLAYWRPVNGDTDVDIPHVDIHPTFNESLLGDKEDDITPLDGSCFCSVNPQATGPIGKCM